MDHDDMDVRRKKRQWLGKNALFWNRGSQRDISKKTWKEAVSKDTADLYLKPSNTVDCSKWRKWSEADSNSDNYQLHISDAGSPLLTRTEGHKRSLYPVFQKVIHFHFHDNFGKSG